LVHNPTTGPEVGNRKLKEGSEFPLRKERHPHLQRKPHPIR
jgi:hypothetical protein